MSVIMLSLHISRRHRLLAELSVCDSFYTDCMTLWSVIITAIYYGMVDGRRWEGADVTMRENVYIDITRYMNTIIHVITW